MELMPCHYCKSTEVNWTSHYFLPTEPSFAMQCKDCGLQCACHFIEQEEGEDGEDYQQRLWGAAEEMWNELQTKLARLELLEAMLQSDAPKQTKGRL